MRDDERGAVLAHAVERMLDMHFGAGIDRACRFVEDQDRREREHDARDAQQLALAFGEVAVVVKDRVVTVWQTLDKTVRVRLFGGRDDFIIAGVRLADRDVVAHGSFADPGILQNHPVAFAQTVSGHVVDTGVFHTDIAGVDIIEAH